MMSKVLDGHQRMVHSFIHKSILDSIENPTSNSTLCICSSMSQSVSVIQPWLVVDIEDMFGGEE